MAGASVSSAGSPGQFVAVGVGPGDPELLTLKGVRILKEADVVITPVGDRSASSIASSIVCAHLDQTRQRVLERVFPMRQPAEKMARAWRDIAAEISGLVRDGKKVAFVTLGDPMLYSTYLYLQNELETNHPDVEIATVPGISSILAAAGKTKWPLAIGDETLSIVPATLPDAKLRPALEAADSLVLLKISRNFQRIRKLIEAAGLERRAVFVRRLGLQEEKIITDLNEVAPDDLDYLSIILVRRERADG